MWVVLKYWQPVQDNFQNVYTQDKVDHFHTPTLLQPFTNLKISSQNFKILTTLNHWLYNARTLYKERH